MNDVRISNEAVDSRILDNKSGIMCNWIWKKHMIMSIDSFFSESLDKWALG